MRQPLLSAMVTLASVLLIGCSDQLDPTDSGADPTASPASGVPLAAAKVTLHFPLEGPFGIGFTSPCTGGSVEGTGEVVGQINIVGEEVLPGLLLGLHVEEHGRVTGTVTDESTGTTYRFSSSYHNSFNTPSGPAPNFTSTSSSTLIAFPTTGSGSKLLIHLTIHTTVDGNGVQRATFEAENFKCVG